MKTAQDPRHQHRIDSMQKLFSASFGNGVDEAVQKIWDCIPQIDPLIQEAAPEWPIEKIAKSDLAILRLACYELLKEQETPQKVVIDEAIELAKTFSNENSPAFVNGVLSTIGGKMSKMKDQTDVV